MAGETCLSLTVDPVTQHPLRVSLTAEPDTLAFPGAAQLHNDTSIRLPGRGSMTEAVMVSKRDEGEQYSPSLESLV